MEVNPVWIVTSLASLALLSAVAWSALRRSAFGVLLLSAEYFYILGLAIFPIVVGLGVVHLVRPLDSYVAANGAVGAAAYVHILMYSFGASAGYFWFPFKRRYANFVLSVERRLAVNSKRAFVGFAAASACVNALYVYIVGINFALLSVAAGRAGDFSDFGENVQFLFLKTLAQVCLIASVVFVPKLVRTKQWSVALSTLLIVAACLAYLNSDARAIFIDTVFVTLAFALYYGKLTPRRVLFAGIAAGLALFILVYGKSLVQTAGLYLFAGANFDLVSNFANYSFWDEFFGHFGHLLFSIDAGIRHFMISGPYVGSDVVLGTIGFIPSSWFAHFGLNNLSYRLVDPQFTCLNTLPFGEVDCSVPAYYPGASAYVLPIAGGFIFGAVRYSLFAVVEAAWIQGERTVDTWLPYLVFGIATNLMLFIPATVSLGTFVLLGLVSLLWASGALKSLLRPQAVVG